MPSRQEIFDAVVNGNREVLSRIDALEKRVAAADAPVDEAGDQAAIVAAANVFTLEEYYANTFKPLPVPFEGSRRINKDFYGDPGYFTCFQFKLKAIEGDITIKDAIAESDNPALQPKFDPVQIRPGRVIKQGKWAIFRCQTRLPGRRTDINWKIILEDGTEEGEKIIDITADFSSAVRELPSN